MQITHGVRRKRALVPQEKKAAQIRAAQAAIHTSFMPSQIATSFDVLHSKGLEAHADESEDALACVTCGALCGAFVFGCASVPSEYNPVSYLHTLLSSNLY